MVGITQTKFEGALTGARIVERRQMMKIHEFSIVASGLDPKADDFETRFFEAGCDDATVAFQKGHIILDFAREAETAAQAIESAIECVKRAGACVDRIEPDPLVSLTDISVRMGITKSAVSNYALGIRGDGFPPPAVKVTSSHPLWRWTEVARWFFSRGDLPNDALELADVVDQTNFRLRASR